MSRLEIIKAIEQMTPEDRAVFLAELQLKYSSKSRSRRISQLRGLGKSLWEKVSVDEYLKHERNWTRDHTR
ncbi:MAG TPA: hypothetical protein DCE81_14880 [Cytophagales bacterium]|jgi:hypothetical protein|nr:hypothetical protein [Cytophagales bacterium]